MGCSISKHASKREGGEASWNAPLLRSMSTPSKQRADRDGDSYHVVSLTPSSHGYIRLDRPGYHAEDSSSFDTITRKKRDLMGYPSSYLSESLPDVKQTAADIKLNPVKEEDENRICNNGELETINTWELMEGLEEAGQSPLYNRLMPSPLKVSEPGRQRLMNRSVSVNTEHDVDAQFRRTIFPLFQKYILYGDSGKENAKPWDGSCQCGSSPKTPLRQPFVSESPANRTSKKLLQSKTFSPRESLDGQKGLKLLLSPAANSSPSQTSPGSTFLRTTSLCGRSSLSPDVENMRLHNGLTQLSNAIALKSPRNRSIPPSDCLTTFDGIKEPSSPLFDPTILATFEKALEAVTEDDVSISSNAVSISLPSECNSEADSGQMLKVGSVQSEKLAFGGTCLSRELAPKEKGFPVLEREGRGYCKKASFVKDLSNNVELRELKNQETLERFELKRPPGDKAKVVLYFTSLHGVRKTYEDCWRLRLILQGLRVHVDERDVWMHSKFRQELTDMLGTELPVPRLFIKGRYIGGAEEVKQLHEEGTLVKLLEGLPIELFRKVCDGCGDVRFIPCLACSGSCKLITEANKIARCPDCNENGLIMCPICS